MNKLISILWRCGLVSILLVSATWLWSVFNTLPDTYTLANAPTSLVENGGTISMTAHPYWDQSQATAELYRKNMKCLNGYLMVPLELSTTGSSIYGITVRSVWLHQNGEWLSGIIAGQFASKSNNHISLLAYGCASKLFTPSQPAKVVAKLAVNGHVGYLSTQPEAFVKGLGMRADN